MRSITITSLQEEEGREHFIIFLFFRSFSLSLSGLKPLCRQKWKKMEIEFARSMQERFLPPIKLSVMTRPNAWIEFVRDLLTVVILNGRKQQPSKYELSQPNRLSAVLIFSALNLEGGKRKRSSI